MLTNLPGLKVKHEVYGEGIIISVDSEQRIKVDFGNGKTSEFQYPTCFKTVMKPLGEKAKAAILKDIEDDALLQAKHTEEKKAKIQQYIAGIYTGKLNGGQSDFDIPAYATVTDFCKAFSQSLSHEIAYLMNHEGKHQHLFDGEFLEEREGGRYYTFESETELHYPGNMPVTIYFQGEKLEGTLVDCEDFLVILSTPENLGNKVTDLEFSVEHAKLVVGLKNKIEKLHESPSSIVRELVCNASKAVNHHSHQIITGQENALRMATSQPITFIWGPPGTGKTETLARIAIRHMLKGKRVLMLSYSNVSVDGACKRVFDLSKQIAPELTKPGIITRYGYPRMKDLEAYPMMTTYDLAINMDANRAKEQKELIRARSKLTNHKSVEYKNIQLRLKKLQKSVEADTVRIAHNARFLATTVTKAYTDSVISNQKFDAVIFDEASMAYIPQVIYAASLATAYFVCLGDFRQLPPIVQNSKQSNLNADIFQYCKIVEAVDHQYNHKWLCMLDTQYRMHPDIANFAGKTMYRGMLKTAEVIVPEKKYLAATKPFQNQALHLMDLSGMLSVCLKSSDESRFNLLSALIAMFLATRVDQEKTVGIITPYHAQSRLLHAMARDMGEGIAEITCATVHQFQGSEKDIIFYDAVDCYRQKFPGILITSKDNNSANRLFNVAMTRARGKFTVLANIQYLKAKKLSENLMFSALIDHLQTAGKASNGKKLTQGKIVGAEQQLQLCDEQKNLRELLDDLRNAKQEIRMDIPGILHDSKGNRAILEALQKIKQTKEGKVKIIIRAANYNKLPKEWQTLSVENGFVFNPVILIDKRITWYGFPTFKADFVAEAKTISTEYYPVFRLEGSHAARTIFGYLDMNNTAHTGTEIIGASEDEIVDGFDKWVIGKVKCPDCGSNLVAHKSKKGNYYLSCPGKGCTHMEYVKTNLVDDYLYRHGGFGTPCPKCKCSMLAQLGKYGLYIECAGEGKHKFGLDEV